MAKIESRANAELDHSPDPFGLGVTLPDGHLTRADEEILREFSANAELVVDLGTHRGRSAAIMACYACRVITIDWYGYKPDKAPTIEQVRENLRAWPNIKILKGWSWDLAGAIEDESADMVFQDAGHSVANIMDDFNAYRPKLRRGGVMIFHDYKYQVGHTVNMAVRPAVNDVIATGLVELIRIAGWCAVVRKR